MAATCHVFTEKEGLLSKVAHDLRIRVDRFDVKIEGEGDARSVSATFDPNSLVVESALASGRDNPGALSRSDLRKIEDTIRKDVLHTKKHPKLEFQSTRVEDDGDGLRVTGDLTLHGRTRELRLHVRDTGDAWETEATLHQPDFGIEPFKAMLGTLKIKPDVRVKLRVPKQG
jgi:polyisoprenoid-binding protein YceI